MAKAKSSSSSATETRMPSATTTPAAIAKPAAGRSSNKRKKDDTSDGETRASVKKSKADTGPIKTKVSAATKKSSNAVSVNSKSKPPPKIQLVIKNVTGGEDAYNDLCEKVFRDRMDECSDDDDEGYYEAKQDLWAYQDGRLGLMEEDPEIDSVQHRMEYEVAINTVEGEDVGHLKFVVVDLADAEFHEFWGAFDCHSDAMGRFLDVFAEDDRAYSYGYRDGHSDGPLLKVDVQSAGTKCWSRHEFTSYREDPLVYVLELVVKDKWRGCGIGSQVYEALASLEPVRRAKYFFAEPGPLEPVPKKDGIKDWIERGRRIRAFHRQVGFRRIGNSLFFARAVDAKHPSRAIKPEDDAGHVPEVEMSEAKRKATVYAYA